MYGLPLVIRAGHQAVKFHDTQSVFVMGISNNRTGTYKTLALICLTAFPDTKNSFLIEAYSSLKLFTLWSVTSSPKNY